MKINHNITQYEIARAIRFIENEPTLKKAYNYASYQCGIDKEKYIEIEQHLEQYKKLL